MGDGIVNLHYCTVFYLNTVHLLLFSRKKNEQSHNITVIMSSLSHIKTRSCSRGLLLKHCGKGRNRSERAISPFATMFSTQFNIKHRFIDILLNFAQMFSKSAAPNVLYVGKGWSMKHRKVKARYQYIIQIGNLCSSHIRKNYFHLLIAFKSKDTFLVFCSCPSVCLGYGSWCWLSECTSLQITKLLDTIHWQKMLKNKLATNIPFTHWCLQSRQSWDLNKEKFKNDR